MLRARDLLNATRKELTSRLLGGHPVDPTALDDTEYRGTSLGLPAFVERLTWKTFRKVFHRDTETGRLRGWNVRLVQHGIDGPSEPETKRGEPVTFGHYLVVDAPQVEAPRGLLLDYGLGQNGRFDPVSLVRDPVVALEEGSVEVLLGWTYLELTPRVRIGTPSFFVLEREGPLSYRPR